MVCLPPSVIAVNGLDGGGAGENDDEPVLLSLSAAPSPQSEAVANELQELSLQPELTLGLHPGRNPNLPPLSERKNGESSIPTLLGSPESPCLWLYRPCLHVVKVFCFNNPSPLFSFGFSRPDLFALP